MSLVLEIIFFVIYLILSLFDQNLFLLKTLFTRKLLFSHFLFLRLKMLGFFWDDPLVEGRGIEILGFLILLSDLGCFFQIIARWGLSCLIAFLIKNIVLFVRLIQFRKIFLVLAYILITFSKKKSSFHTHS